MSRFDLFSKRQNDIAKAGQPDVYKYDIVTAPFRQQLLNIANSAFGADSRYDARLRENIKNIHWKWIDKTFSHEKGILPIGGPDHVPKTIRAAFLAMNSKDALDIVELIGLQLAIIDQKTEEIYESRPEKPALSIEEVNYRLLEAGMGYQLENGLLTRIDSQLIHQEIVKPALTLLSKPGFEGAQQEFLKAHAHYRAGQNKEAVAMAANALESTFKTIFENKGWIYNKGARITDLVKVAKSNGLWPDYLDNSFDQFLATIQNGLPKIRDNDASHGQGTTLKIVPPYLAAYALHLAASKIVFIASAADHHIDLGPTSS